MEIPGAVLAHAQGVADTFTGLTGLTVDAAEILTGRAAMLGLSPRGQISAGGATRLLPTRDGWCALTLSRPDDLDAVPALLAADALDDDPWPAVQAWMSERDSATITTRARLLGLPVAALGETPSAPPRIQRRAATGRRLGVDGLLVADLSSMWAGPLCGQLLASAGATVVKVESAARPDGTRTGPRAFFDWMNSGKLSYSVDFEQPAGIRALMSAADVVIESSRPAALARRKLGPADITPRDGQVWLRVTGHGADGACADWVAFGDDAAVSGGLVTMTANGPAFCGDAIADPLSGLHAALEVAQALQRGGGELIDVSMAAVAATYAALPRGGAESKSVTAPPESAPARSLGADNAEVERRWAPC